MINKYCWIAEGILLAGVIVGEHVSFQKKEKQKIRKTYVKDFHITDITATILHFLQQQLTGRAFNMN